MSTVAIKISAELAAATRAAAKAADRSLTGQIEHWAKIGRAAEGQLSNVAVQTLKQSKRGDIFNEPDPQWLRLVAALESVHNGDQAAATHIYLKGLGQPLYEADPSNPDGIIQVNQDGTRVPGSMVNRTFKPQALAAI